jgi:putative ABC transport system ATP-binding protein
MARPTSPASHGAVLRLEGVCRSFEEAGRRRTVLDRLDLTLADGEVVAVVGPSGSGKTTLLNIISGIDEPDGGLIQVAGMNLSRLDERRRTLFRRRHVGFIFQFFNLIPTLTVHENLLLPLELNGVVGPEAERRAAAMLGDVGLGDRADAYPDRLSGGEQQRVAVARALVHAPSLLLADEPTGNLDRESGAAVLSVIERLIRRTGRSMVVVTHSEQVTALADRVLLLRDGRLGPLE